MMVLGQLVYKFELRAVYRQKQSSSSRASIPRRSRLGLHDRSQESLLFAAHHVTAGCARACKERTQHRDGPGQNPPRH